MPGSNTDQLDVAQTEAEDMIQPEDMADDLRRNCGRDAASSAKWSIVLHPAQQNGFPVETGGEIFTEREDAARTSDTGFLVSEEDWR